MEIHLPKDLRELCDLDSLKLESASFVDEKLRALHSDILWSVKTREGDGYIYVVIEHQSREDIPYGLSPDAIFHGGDAAPYRA